MREARRHLGLTTKEASSIAKVNRDTWEKYELGMHDPRYSAIKAVLIDQGIDPDWLFTGEGPMTTKERRALEPSANDPELVGILVGNILRVYDIY